ncbi:MAG: hypothetical protein QXJ62_04320 [Nitrososphaeria archaeon]
MLKRIAGWIRRRMLAGACTEEDVARAKKTIIGAVAAGILLALSKPLAAWFASGGTATDWSNYTKSITTRVPPAVVNSMDLVMSLITYVGVGVIVIGIIWGGIRWATAE